MTEILDTRGLACPLPRIRAAAALRDGETLVVLATDPEAPIDLAALAADRGLAFAAAEARGEWTIELRSAAPGSPAG